MSNPDKNKNNITISTQVIAASLTMITVVGAFTVFIIEKREVGISYYIITGLAFVCFVISIFLGGRGISGKGRDKTPNPNFNWQAKTALLGVTFFAISVFLSKEKSVNLESRVNEQEKIIIELKTKDEFRAKDIQRLDNDIDRLTKILDDLKRDTICPEGLSLSE